MKGGSSWGGGEIVPVELPHAAEERGPRDCEPTFCGQRSVPTLEKISGGYGRSCAKEKRGPKEASWGQEVVEQP